ncbi:protein unc-93 homolog A-like [Amphiura filiformis]|uniref:protein unc-93 homolog A-like n=1 Tax=Amphiura filiformis TaxID=82378 RepID=UPI003B210614
MVYVDYFSCMMERHWKNLLGVCGGLFLSYGSFITVVSLQSSIHMDARGTASLSMYNICHAFAMLFAPIIIAKIGTKWTMVFGMLCLCIYIACNFYPESYILLPVSTLLGVFVAPLWVAEATHITTTAMHLASTTGEQAGDLVSRFTGIYYWFEKFSAIPGNLISILCSLRGNLRPAGNHVNQSLDHCGGAPLSCNHDTDIYSNATGHNINVDQTFTNILFAVLLGCCVCGILLSVSLIDTLSSFSDNTPSKTLNVQSLLLAVLKVMKTCHFALLTPINILNGLELSFYFGTFTKSFISCTRGLENIGFVMATGGIGGAVGAVVSGTAVKYTGRMAVFSVGFLSQIVFLIWMLLWQPHQAHNWDIYVMVVGLGAGATLRQSQIIALIGILFPDNKEGAYGAHLFFHYIAYSLGFLLNIFLCTFHQLIILTSILVLAMVTYYVLEYDIKQTQKQEKCEKETKLTSFDEVKDLLQPLTQEHKMASLNKLNKDDRFFSYFIYPALIGILFPDNKEGAYGGLLFFTYIAYMYSLGFLLSIFLCTFYQLIIITSILVLAMVTYYVLEYDIKQTKKQENCEKETKLASFDEVKDLLQPLTCTQEHKMTSLNKDDAKTDLFQAESSTRT